jgi:hypothetical protein
MLYDSEKKLVSDVRGRTKVSQAEKTLSPHALASGCNRLDYLCMKYGLCHTG